MRLQGVFAPVTTPFLENGALALGHLRANLEKYHRTGLAGYVVLGSTGEAVMLTEAEADLVLAAAPKAAGAGKTLIAGTGVESTAETIVRTNRAADLGYHAALVRTPHYYKARMTPDAQAEHFQRVADAARIPILIYSVPQFTGIPVEAPLVAILSKHQNIAGIKESSGEVRRVADIIGAGQPPFQTLVGAAGTVYASLQAGAVGAVLAAACPFPELCVDLYNAARKADAARAQVLQEKLMGASKLVATLGAAGVKYAMQLLGYYGGPARRPLLPLTESEQDEVRRVTESLAGSQAIARS